MKTPLAKYLKMHRHDTAAEVGRRMSKHLKGQEPSSASLSQWTTGATAPSAIAQVAMEKATEGFVTPGDWARWKVKKSK